MKMENITNIIEQTVSKKGYKIEERKSISTDSWYFKIYSDQYSLMFRLSDHPTKSDVITLRTDKNLSYKQLVRFVENRCRDLSDRKLKGLLGL
jgi:hypothetical protein